MSNVLDATLRHFDPVGLDELNEVAPMLHRKDRKYLLTVDEVAPVLRGLGSSSRVLETATGRWSGYESVYFDTDTLELFHLAARRRPARCKVRLRRYLDSGVEMVEVKTKDRRGQTVKHRQHASGAARDLDEAMLLASTIDQSAPFSARLTPTLTTNYRRATLLLGEGVGRATIDRDFAAVDPGGRSTSIGDLVIIETKSAGKPSPLDRLLWRAGHRPVKYSKYCTALAALDPSLPANRWHRVLRNHNTPTLQESIAR